MAAVDLLVRIKAVGGSVLDNLSGGAERLNRQLDNTSHSVGEVDRNLKGASNSTSNTTKAFSKMSQGLGGLVRVYAVIAANIFAASAAFEALNRAARVEQLKQSMEAFGMTTGIAMKSLSNEMIKASGAALDLEAAMRAAAAGTTAGFSSSQILGITKVATNASKVLGRDTTDSIDRLTRGLAKLEPELIDELGLMTRVSEATAAYARANGKSANDLTFFEKRMAFTNAVLEEGRKKYDALGESIKANPLAQASADISNFAREIANVALRPISSIFEYLRENTGTLKVLLAAIAVYFSKTLIPDTEIFASNLENAAEVSANRLASFKNLAASQTQQSLLQDPGTEVGSRLVENKDVFNVLEANYERLKQTASASTAAINRAWALANQGPEKQALALDRLEAKARVSGEKIAKAISSETEVSANKRIVSEIKDPTTGRGTSVFNSIEFTAGQKVSYEELNTLVQEHVDLINKLPPDIKASYEATKQRIELEEQEIVKLREMQTIVEGIKNNSLDRAEITAEALTQAQETPQAQQTLSPEQRKKGEGLARTNATNASLIDLNNKLQEGLSNTDFFGKLDVLKKGWTDVAEEVENYKQQLIDAGDAGDESTINTSGRLLQIRGRLQVVGQAFSLLTDIFSRLAFWVGIIVTVVEALQVAYKFLKDALTSDSVKKFAEDVKNSKKEVESLKETIAEITKNNIGFDNLKAGGSIIEAINQKYNSLQQVTAKTNESLEKQIQLTQKLELIRAGGAAADVDYNQARKETQEILQQLNMTVGWGNEEKRLELQNRYNEALKKEQELRKQSTGLADGSVLKEQEKLLKQQQIEVVSERIKGNISARVFGTDPTKRAKTQIALVRDLQKELKDANFTTDIKIDYATGELDLSDLANKTEDESRKIEEAINNFLNRRGDTKTIEQLQILGQTLIETSKSSETAIQNFKNTTIPKSNVQEILSSFKELNKAIKGSENTLKGLNSGIGTFGVTFSDQIYAVAGQFNESQKNLALQALPDAERASFQDALTTIEDYQAARKKAEDIPLWNPLRGIELTLVEAQFAQKLPEAFDKFKVGVESTNKVLKDLDEALLRVAASQAALEKDIASTSIFSKFGGPLATVLAGQQEAVSIGINEQQLNNTATTIKIAQDNAGRSLAQAQKALADAKALTMNRGEFPTAFDARRADAIASAEGNIAAAKEQERKNALDLAQNTIQLAGIDILRQNNKIETNRAETLLDIESSVLGITAAQSSLNAELEKYRGILKDTETGKLVQLRGQEQSLQLEIALARANTRKIEADRAAVEQNTFKPISREEAVARTGTMLVDVDKYNFQLREDYNKIQAAGLAYNEANLNVENSRVSVQQQQLETIRQEANQREQILDILNENITSGKSLKDTEAALYGILEKSPAIYQANLDLVQQTVTKLRELKDITVETLDYQMASLSSRIEARKALLGESQRTRQSRDELGLEQALEVSKVLAEQERNFNRINDEVKGNITFINQLKNKQAAGTITPEEQRTLIELESKNLTLNQQIEKDKLLNAYEVATLLEQQYVKQIEAAKVEAEYKSKFISSFTTLNEASEQIWYQIGVDFEASIENSMGFVQGAANIFTGAIDTAADSFVDAVIEGKDILESVKEGLRGSLIQSIGDLAKDQLKQGLKLGIGALDIIPKDEKGNLKNPMLEKIFDPARAQAKESANLITGGTTLFDLNESVKALGTLVSSNTSGITTPIDMTTFNPSGLGDSIDKMIQVQPSSLNTDPKNIVGSWLEQRDKNDQKDLYLGVQTLDTNKVIAERAGEGNKITQAGLGEGNWLTSNLTDVTVAGFASIATAIAAGGSTKKSILGGVLGIAGSVLGNMVLPGMGGMIGGQIGAMVGARGFANGGVMTSEGPMPLRMYAKGGIANSPQLAMFGEGSSPEAYVPLPDGRSIPVTMQGTGGNVNNISVNVAVDNKGNSQTSTGGANSEEYTQKLGTAISNAVKTEIANQQRPGGLLYRGRR